MRKFPNKIELLSAYLINVREDLTFDIDPIFEITKYSQCPEIDISLNGTLVTSLIDTGSKVTAISEKFYNENFKKPICLYQFPLSSYSFHIVKF